MARRDSFGGYEEERFKDKVDIKLQCSVCLKVLKDPIQCPNEHYFLSFVYSEEFARKLRSLSYVSTSSDGRNLDQTTENFDGFLAQSRDSL